MTSHKWFDGGHLYLVIFTNDLAHQISVQGAMTLRADIRPVIDGLVRVLMQCTMMAFMSGLGTPGFGMLPTGFLIS